MNKVCQLLFFFINGRSPDIFFPPSFSSLFFFFSPVFLIENVTLNSQLKVFFDLSFTNRPLFFFFLLIGYSCVCWVRIFWIIKFLSHSYWRKLKKLARHLMYFGLQSFSCKKIISSFFFHRFFFFFFVDNWQLNMLVVDSDTSKR